MVDWVSQIGGLVLYTIVGTIFIHICAKIAKIDGATIMKAFEVALIGAILALILGLITAWGGLIAFILVIVIIKYIYNTTWGKSVLAWIIYIVVLIIVAVVVGIILGAAFFMALG